MKRFTILILTAAFNIAAFQNCSSSGSSGAATGANATAATTLAVTSASSIIAAYSSTQVTATGGTSPYVYSLISGGGTVDATTGWYTASSTIGTAIVQAKDSAGVISQVAISVTASTSTGTGTGTGSNYSCDDIVPVTATQTCWGTVNGSCTVNVSYYSYVPAGCKVTSIAVYASHFGGSNGSCGNTANFTVTASGTQNTGPLANAKKTANLAVTTNLSNKTMSFTSSTSGWDVDSTSGYAHNACVSGISLELSLTTL